MSKIHKKQYREAFGKAIREHRNNQGLTQQALADKSKIHRTYISDIERGERNLSIDSMVAICDGLELTPASVLMNAESKYGPEKSDPVAR